MRSKSIVRSVLATALLGSLILLFQNCSDPGFKALGLKQSLGSTGTSGDIDVPPVQPYDPTGTLLIVPAGKVAVLFAQGHVGRTLMSCDDGQSWIHDRSDNDAAVCYETTNSNFVECDHSALSANGIDFGDGYFFASFGHGEPGTARISEDGFTWRTIATGNTDAGISYYKGVLNWFAGGYQRSLDLGVTFTNNNSAIPFYFISRTSHRFENYIVVSGDDPNGIISNDSGKTWKKADLGGMQWSRNVFISKGRGMLVAVSALASGTASNAYVMYSKDDGLTWTGKIIYTQAGYGPGWSNMIFDGTKFMGWFNQQMWSSADGINWTATDVLPKLNITNGPITRSAAGTYVAIPGDFGGSYFRQKMYRSADGINWTAVDPTKYKGGHPIFHMAAGYADPAACR